MVAIGYFLSALFLIWQHATAHGWISGMERIVIPKFDANIYCFMAGSIATKWGLLLGIVSAIMGVVYIIDSRGILSSTETSSGKGGKYSYWGIMIVMVLMSFISVL